MPSQQHRADRASRAQCRARASRMPSSSIVPTAGSMSSTPSRKARPRPREEFPGWQAIAQALPVGHLRSRRATNTKPTSSTSMPTRLATRENLTSPSSECDQQPGGIPEHGDAGEPKPDQPEEYRGAAHPVSSWRRAFAPAGRRACAPRASAVPAGHRGPRSAACPPPPGSCGHRRAAPRSAAAICDCARPTIRRRAPVTRARSLRNLVLQTAHVAGAPRGHQPLEVLLHLRHVVGGVEQELGLLLADCARRRPRADR